MCIGVKTYVLDQGALVLEGVTLAGVVQLVVQVLVNLAAGAVLDKKTAEDSEAAHPQNLGRHTGVGSTLTLTVTTGLRMMSPSETSLRMVWRELALEISLCSLGSSQILRLPQPMTDAARRF